MIYVKSFLTGLAILILAMLVGAGVFLVKVKMYSGVGVGAFTGGIAELAAPGWLVITVSLLIFMTGFLWRYLRLE